MIQANELRIGNLVNYTGTDRYYKRGPIEISSIDTEGIEINESAKPDVLFKEIDGIYITEEWLLKAGFEKDKGDVFRIPIKVLTTLNLYFECGAWVASIAQDTNQQKSVIGIHIAKRYVHEIQNLYFVLRGEELIYKP